MTHRTIYCCGCCRDVAARLTNGKEIYPHRPDLFEIPMWRCDSCTNYVGCHHKTNNPTKPLGDISTAEIRQARIHIHALIDPIWQQGLMPRGALYGEISKRAGFKKFHTSKIRSLEEARKVYRVAREISREKSQ